MIPRDVLRHILTLCKDGAVTNIGIFAGLILLSVAALLNLAALAFFLRRVLYALRKHPRPIAAPAIPKAPALAPAHR